MGVCIMIKIFIFIIAISLVLGILAIVFENLYCAGLIIIVLLIGWGVMIVVNAFNRPGNNEIK